MRYDCLIFLSLVNLPLFSSESVVRNEQLAQYLRQLDDVIITDMKKEEQQKSQHRGIAYVMPTRSPFGLHEESAWGTVEDFLSLPRIFAYAFMNGNEQLRQSRNVYMKQAHSAVTGGGDCISDRLDKLKNFVELYTDMLRREGNSQ